MAEYAQVLEDYIQTVEILPGEMSHILGEIGDKDEEFQELRSQIVSKDIALRKLIKNGPIDPPEPVPAAANSDGSAKKLTAAAAVEGFPDQQRFYEEVLGLFDKGQIMLDQKLRMVERSMLSVDRHIRRLNQDLETIARQDMAAGNLETAQQAQSAAVAATPVPSLSSRRTNSSLSSISSLAPSLTHTPSLISSLSSSIGRAGSAPDPVASTPVPMSTMPIVTSALKRSDTPDKFMIPVAPQKRGSNLRLTLANNKNIKMKIKRKSEEDSPMGTGEVDEQLYCFCRQVSYGEMIGCDNDECPNEWFHLDCVGLTEPPKGVWYCPDCAAEHADDDEDDFAIKRNKKKKVH